MTNSLNEGSEPDDVAIATYRESARRWLANELPPRSAQHPWSDLGRNPYAIFHDLSDEQEHRLVQENQRFYQRKYDAGLSPPLPASVSQRRLAHALAEAFDDELSAFVPPLRAELVGVTVKLVAPTLSEHGSEHLRELLLAKFLRADALCCQLFSEPDAGSDLASVRTTAMADGTDWIVTGRKVWTSGAQFADWGFLLARTDATEARHHGLTCFLMAMKQEGVTVCPIRQMTGGRSFNEVTLDEVRVSDDFRVGCVGAGWKVAMSLLGHERNVSRDSGGSYESVLELARRLGLAQDYLIRQQLAAAFTRQQLGRWTSARIIDAVELGALDQAAVSLVKLMWSDELTEIGHLAASILGPSFTADSGKDGTFEWTAHVLGAPANHIAGGSDEIQHNIIGERLLGLPKEPSRGP